MWVKSVSKDVDSNRCQTIIGRISVIEGEIY